ncbi:transcription initiation factor TFIID component TAF4 family-domain-containing protein [Desarmillaria ectypa]|nr:transcription initiation factor TFIID component TAF4 family-domain-containing protein [Desarmillaria ectypa]
MKSEGDATSPPATQTPATTTTTTTTYAQWTTPHIPIDPALQAQTTQAQQAQSPYQHYSPYSHYQYATHYPSYAAAAPQASQSATTTVPRPVTAAVAPTTQSTNSGGGGMDTADIATLNDALGSAGVDLRAEEESLQRSHEQHLTYRSYEDRTRKQPVKPSFDTRYLGATMRTVGTQHKVTRIPDDSVNYLALALRARLQGLVEQMIAAANHRTDTQFDRPASLYEDGSPMWSILVRSDVAKQLAALEKVEREEEMKVRRERKERADMAAAHAAALAAQAAGGPSAVAEVYDDTDSGTKKKRKKEGPGVTARNMSEDVRKKMSNAVASQAAGIGGKYSWMTAANASTPAPRPKAPAASSSPNPAGASTPGGTAAANAASSWSRPYVPTKKPPTPQQSVTEDDTRTTITLRDAMFVIEKERGHGGGRGAARGWI